MKDILKGQIKSTNIEMPIVYGKNNESLRLGSMCDAKDAILAIIQNKNS